MLAFSVYGDLMSKMDWACLSAIILGFVVFLYGANFYDAFAGWIGVYLFFCGVIAFLVIYIYRELMKKEEAQSS